MRLVTPGKYHKQNVRQKDCQAPAYCRDAPEGVFEAEQQSTCYHHQ
ncbi:hypothetical protein ECW26_08260 [Escherichia coli W26]|nr:hypothetical protein ECW26_08260 [Escherichia coli W26]